MVNQGNNNHEFYMEHTGDPLIRSKTSIIFSKDIFRSKMFKLAKSLSPDTMLFLNDHGIIMDRFVITFFRTGMFFLSGLVALSCSNSKSGIFWPRGLLLTDWVSFVFL